MEKKDAQQMRPEDCKYSFFQHRECEFFPCHEVKDEKEFNCLFCYCPLYALGENCGGNYSYTAQGIKDCSHCLVPHTRRSYGVIVSHFGALAELAMQKPDGER